MSAARRALAVLPVLAALAARAAALELDPAACAARFDVQRDKIIRTEESRGMGARYLAELDVGARAECLRLCCETDACDVFVYEEKSPGSCYLFACGPPEDFRCKFTAHGNFSSGVLDVARRRAEQQDRARLVLHEQQLASLRSATAPPPTSASTAAPPAPAPPTTPAPPPLPPPRRCSRYQFECHTGGECIAVYNACDGVPQCADGSDEAPELGCPPGAPPAPPAPLVPPAPPAPAPAPTRSPEQESLQALQVSKLQESGERWPPRLAQAQGRRPHIFSHKGGLLQEPPEPAPFSYDAPPAWPRPPWGQPQSVMDGAWGGYARADWGEPDPRRAWPVPPPRPEPDIPVYIPQKTMPELPLAYGGAQTLRDAPKKGPPARAPSPPPASRAPPEQTVTPKQEQAVAPPAARAEADIEARRAPAPAHAPHLLGDERDERDGLSDRPPAAVLLLVLGVLMTAALALLAGCRARAARRRRGRGKSSLAHDADYLVNGMYL